jgi:pimeloyl-ACP methyl ester carboxylesterase
VTETRVGDQRPSRVVAVDKRTWVQGRPAAYSVAGQGMPVVLLHGWGLGHHTYRDVIERVAAEGVRVIAPAMPGFGGTADLPDETFSMSGYARWVIDLLDVLGVDESVVVLGHSFGGGVSIRLAYDHPDRVRSLVLVNSVGGSAWKQGKTLKSIAERPLWDWGLHFPADIWPVGAEPVHDPAPRRLSDSSPRWRGSIRATSATKAPRPMWASTSCRSGTEGRLEPELLCMGGILDRHGMDSHGTG